MLLNAGPVTTMELLATATSCIERSQRQQWELSVVFHLVSCEQRMIFGKWTVQACGLNLSNVRWSLTVFV